MADESARLMNRFVRPIYDAIDARQYKTALKHCAHKKVAHLDLVQVLKAHCLERTGRRDEALAICRAVQRRQPTDETLLHTMSLVFKLAGCEPEMLPTLEHACAHAAPPSEDLFASLFFAYARGGDFLKQQQTALKMAKAFGGVRYMSWAALSMLLQVQLGGAPPRMLALAERMQLKTLRELASDDGEALQLLVHILQLQGKHADALSAFDEFAQPPPSPAAAAKSTATRKGRAAEGQGAYEEDIELGPMLAIDRLVLEASLAAAVGDWERAARVYRALLEQHSADDWAFLTGFIAARFAADADDGAKVEQDVRAFLAALQARPGNAQLRGPHLAVLHLLSESLARLRAAPDATADADATRVETDLEEQIGAYVERFFAKTCCFSDLQQYLALFRSDCREAAAVAPAARVRLLERVAAIAAASVGGGPASADERDRSAALARLNRRLLALEMQRFLGVFDSAGAAELAQLARALAAEYEAAAWLNVGSTGGQRERAPRGDGDGGDDGIGGRPLLLHAAALLEHGLARSAYNFQMKLLLARVYGYVGAADAMLARHAELDVKHVQLDSLAFLVLDKLLQLAAFRDAQRLVDAIERVHRGARSDTPEYIARAYKTGVYSKVLDMTNFLHRRMQRSHTLAVARSEALVLGLLDAVAGGPGKLHDHLASPAFDAGVRGLEAMLAGPDALSRNQHREVTVRWTPTETVAPGDAFARDGEPLVECDKSADAAASMRWLQLHTVAAALLRGAAAGDSATLGPLATEHGALVAQLGLLPAGDSDNPVPTLQQRLWQWAADAVRATTTLAAAVNGDDASARALATVPSAFAALQSELAGLTEALATALTVRDSDSDTTALSPYGVSSLSLVVGECGLWTLCLLSTTQRLVAKKKARKEDHYAASVGGLRALLKHLQEFYAALEAHVGSLAFDADNGKGNDNDAELAPPLADAQRKVAANVRASYEATQARLAQLLRERVVFTKAK
ncbi:hypothetical protein PybrP1_008232 [[Pythium] brassicae (nom. inval.)]|nr:hypothetical protein PybrP1_008232 [[Pythium] brassicae (nom. inval.)]